MSIFKTYAIRLTLKEPREHTNAWALTSTLVLRQSVRWSFYHSVGGARSKAAAEDDEREAEVADSFVRTIPRVLSSFGARPPSPCPEPSGRAGTAEAYAPPLKCRAAGGSGG
eukprot:6195725-Pleurochrysis_carterae.AAC.10